MPDKIETKAHSLQ